MDLTTPNPLMLETGFISAVNENWQTIQLPNTYTRMVLVTTPMYQGDQPSTVIRIDKGTSGDSFDIRIESPTNESLSPIGVFYIVAEEGEYDDATTGLKFEARQHPVNNYGRPGFVYTFKQTYVQPIIVGSVVTDSSKWNVFFASEVTPTQARVGRLIGDDPNTERGGDRLGMIIIEAGSGDINNIKYSAGIVSNVQDITEGNTTVDIGMDASTAVISPATLNNPEDYWPIIWANAYDAAFANEQYMSISLDKDNFSGDRSVGEESVYYLTLELPTAPIIEIEDLSHLNETSRFLAQAGFGGSVDELTTVFETGFANWIDAQRDLSISRTQDYFDDITRLSVYLVNSDVDITNISDIVPFSWRNVLLGIESENFSTAWLRNVIHNEDQLRQRVTFALSQIFVVSFNDGIGKEQNRRGRGYANYYDTLATHAFGNFRDLLMAVTKHGVMGVYLTYLGNQKASDDGLRQPDENYAREIMQLFTIGLWDLNIDGSYKLDSNGEPIPSYQTSDVEALSRVFTGMWFTNANSFNSTSNSFVRNQINGIAGSVGTYSMYDPQPLTMFEEYHDQGSKTVFSGKPWEETFPANQGGLADLDQAIDMLFNHPNTPPFIARRLIQFLVTSNPSPAYLERVSSIFVDNGNGVRGDLFAIVKQILLDEEAGLTPDEENSTYGKLLEPMIRFTRMVKSFRCGIDLEPDDLSDLDNPIFNDLIWSWRGFGGQKVLFSNSVFNFFQPDFKTGGLLVDNNDERLFSPELQIFDASTAIQLANEITAYLDDATSIGISATTHALAPAVPFNWDIEIPLADNSDALIDRMDTLLANGQMSEGTRNVLKQTLDSMPSLTDTDRETRVKVAVFGVMVSPEAAILR